MHKPSVRVLLVGGLEDTRLLEKQLTADEFPEMTFACIEKLEDIQQTPADVILLDSSISDDERIKIIYSLRHGKSRIPVIWLTTSDGTLPPIENQGEDTSEILAENRNNPRAIRGAIRYASLWERNRTVLQETEERFRIACDASHSIIYDIDRNTNHIRFIQGFRTLLGYEDERSHNQDWWFSQIHADDLSSVLEQLHTAYDQGTDYSVQYRILHKDGHYITVEDTGRNMPGPNGKLGRSVGSVVDITQRKETLDALRESEGRYHKLVGELEDIVEQRTVQLRNLAAELTQAEERERKKLAQAIHDDLQQLLVAAKFCAGSLVQGFKTPELKQNAEQLTQFLDEAIESTRSLTFELSPPILYDAGLTMALQYLGRQMQSKHGLTVNVQTDERAEPKIEELRVLLFQATRELLFNVVKHANVKTAELSMCRLKGDHVKITVSDAGAGFDPEKCARESSQDGFGLFSIRGRLGLAGGRLEIQSAPGKGSNCSIIAPIGKISVSEKSGWNQTSSSSRLRGGMMRAGRQGQDKNTRRSN